MTTGIKGKSEGKAVGSPLWTFAFKPQEAELSEMFNAQCSILNSQLLSW